MGDFFSSLCNSLLIFHFFLAYSHKHYKDSVFFENLA